MTPGQLDAIRKRLSRFHQSNPEGPTATALALLDEVDRLTQLAHDETERADRAEGRADYWKAAARAVGV